MPDYPIEIIKKILPSSTFALQVEEFFDKENSDKVVAWPRQPVPAWATTLKPKILLDLGSGLGGQTSATLKRLGQWGCLDKLERVVLVDHDTSLSPFGAPGLKEHLESKITATLLSANLRNVEVQAYITELRVTSSHGVNLDLEPLADICPKADLILASHITYFFGDGSGKELIEALLHGHRLSTGGVLWVNIRDLHCPAYLARQDAISKLGLVDRQPFDYSEYFKSKVLQAIPHLCLRDAASVGVDTRPGVDRIGAAYLVMWRTDIKTVDEDSQPLVVAAQKIGSQPGPIYSETQFILCENFARHQLGK